MNFGVAAEEKRQGLLAFGAMDADMSGTLDTDEIQGVFDTYFPEYLTKRPESLVRVERGCIDAHMWLLFLREVRHFEGEECLQYLLDKLNTHDYGYDPLKAQIYHEFSGPIFASAIAYFTT